MIAQIRRAYRTLITKVHPDKGGSEDEFSAIQKAYQVLSDASKVGISIPCLSSTTIVCT